MRTTKEIYSYMRKEIKSKQVVPSLLSGVIEVLDKAVETRMPHLIGGDQGVGKTFGCMYYAYKKGYDITLLNASDELRLSKNDALVRSEIMRPNRKIKLVVIDEVEKGSGLGFLSKMVAVARKSAYRTNVIVIFISNNPWQLGSLKEALGSMTVQIKPPFVKTLSKALKDMNIEYKGQMKRDIRFFRNIVKYPRGGERISALSENTFEAFGNFLSSHYLDRNAMSTLINLNAPLWKWLISNFHHGTANFLLTNKDGSKRQSYPKHNTGLYYRMVDALSKADQYKSHDLLEFVVPQMPNSRFTHPSSLSKRNKT